MTQVVYGQKGYLGSSMSVRAAEAYEQGEMPISRWTKTAIIQAVKDYCFDFDLAYDPDIEKKTKAELAKEFLEYKSWHHSSRTAREVEFFGLNEDAVCRSFEQMSEEQIIERDRQMAAEQAAQEARLQFMNAREKEFEQKFGCNPSSVLAYEAVHPEMCTRFIARRKKTEMISYRLPAEAVKAGMKEEQVCPLAYAGHSRVGYFDVFIQGTGKKRHWENVDFEALTEKFDKAAEKGKRAKMQPKARLDAKKTCVDEAMRVMREPWRLQSPKRSWRGRKTRGDRNGPRRQTSQNRESPGFNYGECQNLKTLSQNLVADNAVDNSQLELADFDRVFPTVGISHDESMSRRYLMFDLDSASLKKEFGPTRYALAYSDLREALENRGFEHRQGSGYLSKAPISKNKLIVLYDSLVEELPWLNTCSTAMHFADIGKTFNLKTLARNSSTSISDVEFFRNQGTQKRTSRASAESKTQSARATGKDNIIQFAPRQNGKDIPSSKGTSLASKSQKYVAMANALNAASKSYVYRNEVAR